MPTCGSILCLHADMCAHILSKSSNSLRSHQVVLICKTLNLEEEVQTKSKLESATVLNSLPCVAMATSNSQDVSRVLSCGVWQQISWTQGGGAFVGLVCSTPWLWLWSWLGIPESRFNKLWIKHLNLRWETWVLTSRKSYRSTQSMFTPS